MKEIKKSASFKSKQKGKDVKFNIDLNYSPEYDSFIIKVKQGEGFMAYSSNIERMPLEVIQKLNEMLEEVLIQAGSKTEMMEDLEVELGAEPNPNHSLRSHEGSVKIKTHKVKVKSLSEAQNEVRGFIEENDLGAGNFTGGDLFSHGKKIGRVSYNGRLWNLKDEPMKMSNGGDFQSGVYADGGYFDGSIPKVSTYMTNYAKGGSLEAQGIEVGDMFIKTISGGIQKVKDKNGKIFYINLANGERDSQPPLPFKNGGGVQDGIEEDIDMTDDYVLRVRKPAMPNRKLSNLELAEKHNSGAYEFMGKDKMATGGEVKLSDLKVESGMGAGKKTWEVSYPKIQGKGVYFQDQYTKEEAKKHWLENVASKYKFATGGGVGLVGNQKRIDMNKNGKIDAEDFKLLRSSMNGAWRNERKHVNQSDPKQDYEVRYAKPRPNRTGYKGKRKFGEGGGISNFERFSRVVAKNYEGKRVKPQYQKEYGKVYSKSEAKEVGNKTAGKVKSMQKAESGTAVKKGGKGGIMVLAKKIRKEGESWQDALKRAGQQLK